ncbi:CDP-glucose 4,6-dehydratase [Sulfobacillus harzensis]|uniref:CDP-glucose 4,6-dehydratase n=1 Tax=Sulfobacillus harzensis TaxID=2729629 RepID=A0A7Y0L6Q4_9FIRM|nr:CDP-glucose 4,6-dehydratase [Sulfobacillus harzensis]NMP23947.1 CDP-glucose 4,6-dehydratase [Sulfobacillus harzensis]
MKPFYRDRRVFVTGHTGFKGSWLTLLLQFCKAKVYGFSLQSPPSDPSMFRMLNLDREVSQGFGDVRDPSQLSHHLHRFDPEIVIHLAAQPLVSAGHQRPAETFETNIMGTVNLLEACKDLSSLQAIIVVTSDKCYLNGGARRVHPFTEDDPLGGKDPYSASKASQDWITQAYWQSWFKVRSIGTATVRAGNVIGGGDWAYGRLVPDIIRAIISKQPLVLRYPASVRPWQHVLEPLAGYLRLGQMLVEHPKLYSGAWNFGPNPEEHTVRDMVESFGQNWGVHVPIVAQDPSYPEIPHLMVNSTKATTLLGWCPTWDFSTTVHHTVEWYRQWAGSAPSNAMRDLTMSQIQNMLDSAVRDHAVWAEVIS